MIIAQESHFQIRQNLLNRKVKA